MFSLGFKCDCNIQDRAADRSKDAALEFFKQDFYNGEPKARTFCAP